MITFIHTADWQLGKPFSRIANDDKRSLLRRERFNAIRRIGDVVRQHGAAFVVVAGDLFDSNNAPNPTISDACEAIKSIGVPVYVIPGNHDHAGPGSVWEQRFFLHESRERAPNLHVLTDPEPVEIDQCVLLPCPLRRRQSAEDPVAWIRDVPFDAYGDRPRIVLAHGSTISFTQDNDEEDAARQANHIDLARLPIAEIDYVALGDWHGFVPAGEKAWYSGSHETDRFPKTDQTTGHVAVVRAGRRATPTVVPVRTGNTRWLAHAETFVTDAGPEMLKDTLKQLIGTAERGQSLLKLSLSGSLGLKGHEALDELIESLQSGLIDLRLVRNVAVAPTREEIDDLTKSEGDPLIKHVARELAAHLDRGGDDAAVAGIAISLLHTFVPKPTTGARS